MIVHSGPGRRIVFDEAGLCVATLFLGRLRLAWSEVEFVCVTPTMVRGPDGWREKENTFCRPGFRSTFASSGTLHLGFVVRDRRSVIAHAEGFRSRTWVRGALRPLLGANDRPKPGQALLAVPVRASRLDHPIDALLDLLSERCRFDLVVSF